MYKKNYFITLMLCCCIATLLPKVSALAITKDSKLTIHSYELDRLPKKLRPRKELVEDAAEEGKNLYLVIQELMLVGGGIEQKPVWRARKVAPGCYAIKIVCSSGLSDESSISYLARWSSRSSVSSSTSSSNESYLESIYNYGAQVAYTIKRSLFG